MDLFESTAFDRHVERLVEQWHVPGLAIAVVQNDRVASKGYGYASLSPKRAVTGDTIFNIASSSKSLTAASVALLVADDERYPHVQWDAIVSQLLPDDFVMAEKSYTESVTVEDMLSHRTGLPRHDLSYFSPRAAFSETPQSVLRNLRNLDIAAPLRTKWLYCNIMFTAASCLVERVAGLKFADFLQERFFTPLGMTSTFLQPRTAVKAGLEHRMALPYYWESTSSTYQPIEVQHAPEAQGAGLLASSANDYIKWVRAMMNRESPVSEDVSLGLTKPRSLRNPEATPEQLLPHTSTALYAAGLMVEFYRGYRICYHHGGVPGVSSRHFFLPEVKFGGVILGNANGTHRLIEVLMHELIDAALGIPQIKRVDWNEIEMKRQKEAESEDRVQKAERRKRLVERQASINLPQGQEGLPLTAYVGRYLNVGYGSILVEMRNEALYIDATDRSFGFRLDKFESVGGPGKYIARGSNYLHDGDVPEFAVEFHAAQDGRVIALGMDLESEVEDYILFERGADEG